MKIKKANIIIAFALATGLSVLSGCESGSSSESLGTSIVPPSSSSSVSESSSEAPVALSAVTNLSVVHHDESSWTVTFEGVTNASGYKVKIMSGEATVVALSDIENGGTVAAQTADGVYVISVKAVASSANFTDSEFASTSFKVENWVAHDLSGVQFTGRVENDLPYGAFTLAYSDGSTYHGTLTDTFLRLQGKHQYPNNMYYDGAFVNDAFEGQGLFSWSTTGNYLDANYYEGQFIGGNTYGCTGTFSWVARNNEAVGGIMYWTGIQNNMGMGAKSGEQGEGAFRYLNNSVYAGGLYFNGNDYLRKGQGINLWTVSENSGWITGGDANKNIYGFVGQFDSVNHGWIYGQGVWYFTNTDGTPYGYISGIWDGGGRIGAWAGFNPATDVIETFKTATNLTPA